MADPATLAAIGSLLDVMARLRAPGGCPWDREQTPSSLRRYVLEEAYETVDAIESGDQSHIVEELGDLLLQVVFQAQMASESGDFTMKTVADAIVDKLVRRHPHVFGDAVARTAREVAANWQRAKDGERAAPDAQAIADAVPRALPALTRAEKIAARLSRRGFDWPSPRGPLEKLREELNELEAALDGTDRAATEHELGDVLLAAASLARHLEMSAELSLRHAVERLVARATAAEAIARARGIEFHALGAAEQAEVWAEAKSRS